MVIYETPKVLYNKGPFKKNVHCMLHAHSFTSTIVCKFVEHVKLSYSERNIPVKKVFLGEIMQRKMRKFKEKVNSVFAHIA